MIKFISRDGMLQGEGYETEDYCVDEGCNGTQYEVEWNDNTTTTVCGKGLEWLDDETAKLI